jgi:hypothetical protein
MYKKQTSQLSFDDFDQPLGLTLNPNNRWVIKARLVPWASLEADYAKFFPSHEGNVAKPFRMACGALLIQKEFGYSDEELVEQIQENPYLQYFIGLPGYTQERPFDASTLVYFRKRLDKATLNEINEKIIQANQLSQEKESIHDKDSGSNSGTLILDATCAPQNIKFPTDSEMLNTSREKAEGLIASLCLTMGVKSPRTYRQIARREYLSIVRRKKKSAKFIRKQNKKLLQFLERDLRSISKLQADGGVLTEKETETLVVIQEVAHQQREMLRTHSHSVGHRIVSVSQPYLRPIVRGKARAAVEFGAKLDLSVSGGFFHVERVSYEAFNESEDLVNAVRRYVDREGHYPEVLLADKIYRTRANLAYCKARGIRLSGPALGRPKKDQKVDKALAYQDNGDRIEVERAFSLMKRCFGLDMIKTKRSDTTETSILLSVIAANLSLWHFFKKGFWGRISFARF